MPMEIFINHGEFKDKCTIYLKEIGWGLLSCFECPYQKLTSTSFIQ